MIKNSNDFFWLSLKAGSKTAQPDWIPKIACRTRALITTDLIVVGKRATQKALYYTSKSKVANGWRVCSRSWATRAGHTAWWCSSASGWQYTGLRHHVPNVRCSAYTCQICAVSWKRIWKERAATLQAILSRVTPNRSKWTAAFVRRERSWSDRTCHTSKWRGKNAIVYWTFAWT